MVLLSILVQGSSLMWFAKKLKLVLPYEEKSEPPFIYDEKSDGRELYQFTISKDNPLAGRELGESELKNSPVLLMITRGNRFIQPKPDVILKQGDSLSFLGARDAMKELHEHYFPNESYHSPMTFRQVWKEVTAKYFSQRSGNRRK